MRLQKVQGLTTRSSVWLRGDATSTLSILQLNESFTRNINAYNNNSSRILRRTPESWKQWTGARVL